MRFIKPNEICILSHVGTFRKPIFILTDLLTLEISGLDLFSEQGLVLRL